MNPNRALVVFYSRTGHTRKVAEAIARASGADTEELIDTVNRRGRVGYLRCAFDVAFKRTTRLRPTRRDPADYDLVILGSPVWAAVSTPMRTYLLSNRSAFKRVAFFLTLGGMGADKVFKEMRTLAGREPAAELAVTERELDDPTYVTRVESFVRSLVPPTTSVPVEPAAPAAPQPSAIHT